MKKFLLTTLTTSILSFASVQAGIVYFGPQISYSVQTPVRAVIIDANGNTIEKTYTYDPAMGGIDLDLIGGPQASIYFPDTNVRYLWYDGRWVDADGCYYERGRRYYVTNPGWNIQWTNYWSSYPHDHWHHYWERGHNTVVNINVHDDHGHWHEGHDDHGHWHEGHEHRR